MNRFFRILVLLFAVSVSSAFAQTSTKQLNVPVPREGFPINVQKLPDDFPESIVLFMAIDLKNKVAPEDVNVCVIGPNITDEFKLTGRGAQRNYSALQLSGDLEITITKTGYKTIKEKIKIEGGSAVAIRLDKGDTAQQKTYKVGDYYNDGTKEGVVFLVDDKGTSGKIVSLDEAELPWFRTDGDAQHLGLLEMIDGKVNTDKVMSRADRTDFPAFVWCRNKGADWYLPAGAEVTALMTCVEQVNNTLEIRGASKLKSGDDVSYWSSTEITTDFLKPEFADLFDFFAMNYSKERFGPQMKALSGKVRAVSRFGNNVWGNMSVIQIIDKMKAAQTNQTVLAAKTYIVGDYYNDGTKEGVVFWVDATGKHGKIVSMQQTSASWSSDEAEQKCYIGALSKTDGEANMKVVMGRPNWKANYPAFAWCANLGEGWYLPAIDELEKFTLNDAVRNAVNRTLAAKSGAKLSNESSSKVMWYWSSTEREYQYPNREYSAQLISMDAATIGRARKSVQGPTRAVAQF